MSSKQRIADLYFLEHRAKLIDLAAFLDRVDRAGEPAEPPDFRVRALVRAAAVLTDGAGSRARRVLEMLSDPSTEPARSAAATKGASGAPRQGAL
ncbi:MAG: hypothetical protein C0475_02335 [Planctomyces sp.]|nr:hypothetical protein [Planctomyces sp.]MBA4038899.1 hypothetical protein [Planctomyces sp.]MBA4120601.1 hypothetical protein [Isosphaera sp.]